MKISHTFAYGTESVKANSPYPIASMPDDLFSYRDRSASALSRTTSAFDLLEFARMIREGEAASFSPAKAIFIAERLEKRAPRHPHILPVQVRGRLMFVGLYDYPRYRFLDWIQPEINIRLTCYTCVVPVA